MRLRLHRAVARRPKPRISTRLNSAAATVLSSHAMNPCILLATRLPVWDRMLCNPTTLERRRSPMQSRIVGTTMPVLEVLLQPGEAVISEAGELSWMSQTIGMTTHTQMAGGGGFFGAIKRMAGGGTLFMTEYTAQGYPGEVAFATKIP